MRELSIQTRGELKSPEEYNQLVLKQDGRTFVRLREFLVTHEAIAQRLAALERKYDGQFDVVFEAIRELMAPPPARRRRRIGFEISGKS